MKKIKPKRRLMHKLIIYSWVFLGLGLMFGTVALDYVGLMPDFGRVLRLDKIEREPYANLSEPEALEQLAELLKQGSHLDRRFEGFEWDGGQMTIQYKRTPTVSRHHVHGKPKSRLHRYGFELSSLGQFLSAGSFADADIKADRWHISVYCAAHRACITHEISGLETKNYGYRLVMTVKGKSQATQALGLMGRLLDLAGSPSMDSSGSVTYIQRAYD